MITAQDVLSGYGQRKGKATTSILPYLREQEKQRNENRKEQEKQRNENRKEQEHKKNDAGAKKSENDLQGNPTGVSEMNQYDKARMEILRGDD